MRARDLLKGSIVATEDTAYIKRVPGPRDDRYPYWMPSEAYAWPVPDEVIDTYLREGLAKVLRTGDGKEPQ